MTKISLQRARAILKCFPRQRILVVGDLMLDRYLYGGVSRISPEAPVPIVAVSRQTSMPGGASNVAWNVQSLGARSSVAGLLGCDHAGHELKQLLKGGGVSVGSILETTGQQTTVKMRVIAERQQVVRVDYEERHQLSAAKRKQFLAMVRRAVMKSTGVIIEDYDKGVIVQEVVDAILSAARQARIPVGLDPKDTHELNLAGITVATPNRKEAFVIAGVKDPGATPEPLKDAPLLRVSEILLEKMNLEFLLVTLGPHGMLLLSPKGSPRHVPTRAREVFDVSGAGDTVIAACVTALAAGASHIEAAELANYAAGVVVGKLGTATCARAELLNHITRVDA
ncbi:MAG: D-glycero-beta-D-manno-heptose-7-phosphate kinase [Lentisphaerota bacterium]